MQALDKVPSAQRGGSQAGQRLAALEATVPHLATKADIAFVKGQVWALIALWLATLVPLYLRFLGWA